jgi:esterase/lipase
MIKLLILLLFIFFSSLIYISLNRSGYDSRLEKTSEFNYLYDFSGYSSYQQYQQSYKEAIIRTRLSLNRKEINYLAPKDNSPSCSKGNKTAVLLIHGLSDSPFSMSDVEKIFNQKCYFTRSMIVPGHALVPGALLSVDYQDWINSVDFVLKDLRKNFKNVIIVGLSNGGTLAINRAYNQKDNFIKTLILFSPAIEIKKLDHLWWVTKIMSVIGNYLPRLAWISIKDDADIYKYESSSYKSAYEIYKLMQINKKLANKNKLNMPLFMVISNDDQTVDPVASTNWFMKSGSHKKMIAYSNLENKNTEETTFIKTINLNKKILDLSHVALSINKDNYYCGEHPLYVNCLHYYGNKKKYNECKNTKDIYEGEITNENLKKYTMRRISYNPDFDDLKKSLIQFIDKTIN